MRFVGVNNTHRRLASAGPGATIAEITDAPGMGLRRWLEFKLRPRVASHLRDGITELIPTINGATYGSKFVNGHSPNPVRGYQAIAASGMLANVHSGYPHLQSEMTIPTAPRTVTMSDLATKHPVPEGPCSLGLISVGS